MKRKLIWIFLVITLLIVASVLVYKIALPTYIANVVTSDTPPAYLPEKYKIQLEGINKPLKKYSEEAFKITDSLKISLDLILKIIDNVNPKDVYNVYNQLKYKTIEDNELVFNLIIENIEIKEIDVTLYKNVFLKYATPTRINRALRYAETHDLAANLAPATAKKIAKQIAIKHYNNEKISKEDFKLH